MTDKDKALAKLKIEINKDIDLAIEMAKMCGMLELLNFLYALHCNRIAVHAFDDKGKSLKMYVNASEESLKYIISLVIKYGHLGFYFDKDTKKPILNMNLVDELLSHANYINSKFETEALVKLFDVKVSGERDRYLRIDMSVAETDSDIKKLFNYFLRIDLDNDTKKDLKETAKGLLGKFIIEYEPFSDFFENDFGITIKEFCWFIEEILDKIIEKAKSKEHLYKMLENGKIDILDIKTFLAYSQSYIHGEKKILKEFDNRFHKILNTLIFDKNEFDERQLQYHYLTRNPILKYKDTLILSPEIILDSLFLNIHYLFLESPSIKNPYIAKQASYFLDKIVTEAEFFGYKEVEREKDLYDGKNLIGDIDIILKNDDGHYLLIEAKNHVLPLDVYFKDVNKTQDHLKYLKGKWEKKVVKRNDHLKVNHDKYSISKNFTYLVVSKFPEVISHYSDILILSLHEFKVWLERYNDVSSFSDFYDRYYETEYTSLTSEEMDELQGARVFLGKFTDKNSSNPLL